MEEVEEGHVFNDGGTVLRRHTMLVRRSRRLVMGKGERQ